MNTETRNRLSSASRWLLILMGLASITVFLIERYENEKIRKHFGEALTAADAGRWFWDLDSGVIDFDTNMCDLYGTTPDTWPGSREAMLERVHPEDRARVLRRINSAIEQRGIYQDVFRVVDPAGETLLIRSAGMVSMDGSYMTGISLPVAAREGNFHRPSNVYIPFIPLRFDDSLPLAEGIPFVDG